MNKQPVQKHYSDLIGTPNNASLEQLVDDLNTYYTGIEPPQQLNWNTLRMQHIQKAVTKPRGVAMLFRPNYSFPLRISVVLVFLLTLLVIASTAYAALLPLLTQTLNGEPGTQQLLQNHQYKDLHIPKAFGGFTFTIEKAYADSNRVIVGLTMKNPPDHPSDEATFVHMKLLTQQGLALRPVEGIGTLDKGMEGDVFSFDASAIQGNPSELHIALIADTLDVVRFEHKTPQEFRIQGTLNFYFTVPFHHGRILNMSQSVTSGKHTITLQKVIVTSSETQAFIGGIDANQVGMFYIYTATLSVEGHEYPLVMAGKVLLGKPKANNTFFLTFPYPLMEKHGTWTLTLKQDPNAIKWLNPKPAKEGPWVFHFIVP